MRRNTVTRMQLRHKRRFESLNNNDKRNAVAKFLGLARQRFPLTLFPVTMGL